MAREVVSRSGGSLPIADLAESIVATVREPLLLLDADLRVVFANRSFYETFQVTEDETIGRLVYELGNRQWDIPALRQLLSEILPKKSSFTDFQVEHDFPHIGHRVMLLNARELRQPSTREKLILLAIEDVTERKRIESELARYREHLEELVRERSRELAKTNEQLQLEIAEHKRAEEALKAAYERERHVSQLLQRALIPPEPSIGEGYPTAAAYVPAFAEADVGGDFYDVFQLVDERVGILIGDVSGKGVEAASRAAATRNTIRALAYVYTSPAEVFARTSDILYVQESLSSFVTALLIILDPVDGRIRYVSGGHPPSTVLKSDGAIRFLAGGSMPLGVMANETFEEHEYRLDPGDTVVVYTDGVTEARSNSDLFGLEGVERVLRENKGKEPASIRDALLDAVRSWSHNHLRDDIGIIVFRRV